MRPSLLHLKVRKTSSIGTFSCNKSSIHKIKKNKIKKPYLKYNSSQTQQQKMPNKVKIPHKPTRNPNPRKQMHQKAKLNTDKIVLRQSFKKKKKKKTREMGCSVLVPSPQLLLPQPPKLQSCHPSQSLLIFRSTTKRE